MRGPSTVIEWLIGAIIIIVLVIVLLKVLAHV